MEAFKPQCFFGLVGAVLDFQATQRQSSYTPQEGRETYGSTEGAKEHRGALEWRTGGFSKPINNMPVADIAIIISPKINGSILFFIKFRTSFLTYRSDCQQSPQDQIVWSLAAQLLQC